jgi:hypothetical protein
MITVENCIKVLIRAKKMYDSKSVIVKLIKIIVKRESLKVAVEEIDIDEDTKDKSKN